MIQQIRILLLLLLISVSSTAQDLPSSYDFTENKGQWDKRVLFHGKLSDGAFFLAKDGFYIVQYSTEDMHRIQHALHPHVESTNSGGPIFIPDGSNLINPLPSAPSKPPAGMGEMDYRAHAIKVTFRNANPNPEIAGEKEIGGASNYFYGNDPSKWASNAKTYTAVTYRNVYPNIDIRFISAAGGLKYDIIVRPGGNPKNVILDYEGAQKLQIVKNQLIITTSVGKMIEDIPESYTYQDQKGREKVTTKFELLSPQSVGFKVNTPGADQTLVIDPSLVFSSFTGSPSDQYGYTATPGRDGSLFSGGISWGPGFPTSTGAFQGNFLGEIDISIFRFNSTGSQRMYATYIGGNAHEYPHSLIADEQGNLVVLGRTNSSNFPGTREGPGGGFDIALCKLNATGTALIGSLLIGGSGDDGVNIQDKFLNGNNIFRQTYRFYGDDSRSEVIFKDNGNILIVSQTQSSNFPMRGSGFNTSHRGAQDGIVAEIDVNCQNILWSSYLGGSSDDAAFVLTQHPITRQIYVAGATSSSDFLGANSSTFQGAPADGFISIISPNGNSLVKTVFVSTNRFDGIYGIQTDRAGDIYIMGVAEGGLSVINANYSNNGGKQFVGKLSPDLDTWHFRTVWGSGGRNANVSPVAFMVDRCQNMYIAGWGGLGNSLPNNYGMEGTIGLPITADAIKSQTDNQDLYFMVMARNADSLIYGTYFGQNQGYPEHIDGGTSRFDQQGVIYMAVCANCMRSTYPNVRFPTTVNAWSRVNGSNGCNLAAIKISFNYTGVISGVSSYNAQTQRFDTIGCVPFSTVLKDTMLLAKSYEWQIFNSSGTMVRNETTTHYELPHIFDQVDTYTVRLIAIDPATCNERDTSEIRVHVGDNEALLNFDYTRGSDCTKFEYTFNNLSQALSGGSFSGNVFRWDFGDGHTQIAGINDAVTHTYAREGNYKVTLTLTDPAFCNAEEPLEVNLRVTETLVAQIATQPGGCFPYLAQFTNLSLGGISFRWDFGDGGATSTDVNPTHTYTQPGTYTVRLIAEDEFTCNKIDTTYFTLTVANQPVSAFSYTPTTVVPNSPFVFTNQSVDAVQYKWSFGDGTEFATNSRSPVTHDYLYSGTYEVILVAINQFGCTDTARQTVRAEVHPSFDVPNAFTPGRGGENSIVKVKGYGIVNMRWVIYNRWGQKMFESTDKNIGWDGTFNGKLQPMDVYTYTLEIEMTNGEKYKKTGDITLIR
ncbi:DUF7948 domain-containing protein [Gynurincola endophyticus]|uniref:DUF7948 domain-containing protein n=1 Tax=Gynurincola endophyticus TaxID=2479004 RepID=UPI000F8EA987|nr:PKD domain-containing protein [Gynurincola endophyticus]